MMEHKNQFKNTIKTEIESYKFFREEIVNGKSNI
jgi:hypothetical protein